MIAASPNTFAGSPLDRAGHLRGDAGWLAQARAAPETRFAVFHGLRPLLRGDQAAWLEAGRIPQDAPTIFLGIQNGAPRFAVVMEHENGFEGSFVEMRAAAMVLPHADSAILGCARSLLDWHEHHAFCARCGGDSLMVEAGWKRQCRDCNAEHFPRVDPVVIMLALHDGRCLLGRQARFPEGMFSALAGFVEPGESFEEACARELFEEAGVKAVSVRYHSTQPWPFPSSLMIGLFADVESDALCIDETEIETARWFTRAEACDLLAHRGALFAPPPLAIAHQLIKAWAAQD